MKKWVLTSAVLLVALAVSATAMAAGPRPKRGDVVGAVPEALSAEWVTGVSQDGGAKATSLAMTDFAYYSFPNWWDQNLSDVKKVRASWLLTGTNSGGSPRFSLELDVDANGTFDCPELGPCVNDVIVYLDPAHCSDPAPSGGGWVKSNFTGDRTNCTIFDSTGASYTSDSSGTAWSKLVAAYPTAKVWFMFLIQDASSGTNNVDRIKLDSAFFT